ncbi:hypothetical protein V6N13_106198 [Hibiscus sabdariffa]|uniref:F-box domain-containing protein n=1 Tax=Hibiscus sabdariffa TaxID=183260 RepID=A0ABR2EZZ5_9ROSI
MELRYRNYESKVTRTLRVPPPFYVHQLLETLLSSNIWRGFSPSSIRFSLNGKDVLQAPSPLTPLRSLGIAPGDLIFFSFDPYPFQDPNQTPESSEDATPLQESLTIQDPPAHSPYFLKKALWRELRDYGKHATPVTPLEEMYRLQEETQRLESLTLTIGDPPAHCKRLYNPHFLMKVLWRELGDYGDIPKLFAVAVHAVLLESGFLGFDPVSGLQTDRFRMRDAPHCPFSLGYSLPELLRDGLIDFVVVKFQTLGHFILVYGSLDKGSGIHILCLDATHLAAVLSDCGTSNDGSFNSNVEKQVSEFWKIVKDGLASPLLIDLCYKTGLPLPACFVSLPTALKRKILESLPFPAIARMACVCREFRRLGSEEELWKQKFREEFGETSERVGIWSWKLLFRMRWKNLKQEIQALKGWQGSPRVNDRAVNFPVPLPVPPLFHPFVIFYGPFGLPYGPPNIYLPALQPQPPLQFQGGRGRGRFGHHGNLGEGQNDA